MLINAQEARELSNKYFPSTDYVVIICRRIRTAAVDGRRSLELDFVAATSIPEIRKLGFNVDVFPDGVVITW